MKLVLLALLFTTTFSVFSQSRENTSNKSAKIEKLLQLIISHGQTEVTELDTIYSLNDIHCYINSAEGQDKFECSVRGSSQTVLNQEESSFLFDIIKQATKRGSLNGRPTRTLDRLYCTKFLANGGKITCMVENLR